MSAASILKSAPSSIARTLSHLNKTPAPVLAPNVKSLKLTMAFKNAHYGARSVNLPYFELLKRGGLIFDMSSLLHFLTVVRRHFWKEELPRVAYHNPSIAIDVERKPKAKEEEWDPELVVGLGSWSSPTPPRLTTTIA